MLETLKGANDPYSKSSYYQRIVCVLQYLTMIQHNLLYSLNTICQYMYKPTIGHYELVKRILRYVHGTVDLDLYIQEDI